MRVKKLNGTFKNFILIAICSMMFVTVFGINKTVSAQVVKTAQDTAYISKDNSNEAIEKAIRVYKEIDENTHSIKWTVKFNPGNENWSKGIFHYVWVPQKENAEMFVSREYSTGYKDEIKILNLIPAIDGFILLQMIMLNLEPNTPIEFKVH